MVCAAPGGRGRRALPIHGIIPYATAVNLRAKVTSMIAKPADAATATKLTLAATVFAIWNNALLYEPVFYWEDALSPYQGAKTAASTRYPDNPAARDLVEAMRTEMVEAMYAAGAAHLQIGRRYPFARDRDLTLLRAVEAAVDPSNLLNPGVLGL